MIGFALLLALLDVFVVSQISFWGVVPLLCAVLVYMFRYEARMVELVMAASVYAFVVSMFSSASQAFVVMLATSLAAFVSIGLLRVIGDSRLRIRMRGYDASLVGISFVFTHWLTLAAWSLSAVSLRQLTIFVLWSTVLTLGLMITVDLIQRKVAVR